MTFERLGVENAKLKRQMRKEKERQKTSSAPRSATALTVAGHKCVLCSKAYDSLKGLKIQVTRIRK